MINPSRKSCLRLALRLSSAAMNTLAIGLWGCFFGVATLMVTGAAIAYIRSLRRIAINAAASALISVFFVIAFLGGLPIENPDVLARVLAHISVLASGFLAYLLFTMLGMFKSSNAHFRAVFVFSALALLFGGGGWLVSPLASLALATCLGLALCLAALFTCIRSALRGDQLAKSAALGVVFLILVLAGTSWIALNRQNVAVEIHILSAASATLYLGVMAWVMWARYEYLLEMHKVMAYGPSYDPVTRMRSQVETGHMVGAVFNSFRDEPAPLGIIVLSIANFHMLDKLHGQAAVNLALFVCAGRLRRCVPAQVEMGRLGPDGFILVMRNCSDSGRLVELARLVAARLSRPLSLNTRGDVSRRETDNTVWVAEIGMGVLMVSNPAVRGSSAIAMGRGMSRTAMSYASRIAWFDYASGEMVELPVLAAD